MKNLRYAKDFGSFQHRPREKGKALCVVGIVAGGSSIKSVAIEIRRIFNKIKADTALDTSGNDRRKAVFIIKWNGDAANDGSGIAEFSLAVARKVDADLVSKGGQSAREGTYDVSQAAGLRKRDTLGSSKGDVHECGTSSRAFAAVRDMMRVIGRPWGPNSNKMRVPTCKSTSREIEGQRAKGSFRAPSANQAQIGTAFFDERRVGHPHRRRAGRCLGHHGTRNRPRQRDFDLPAGQACSAADRGRAGPCTGRTASAEIRYVPKC